MFFFHMSILFMQSVTWSAVGVGIFGVGGWRHVARAGFGLEVEAFVLGGAVDGLAASLGAEAGDAEVAGEVVEEALEAADHVVDEGGDAAEKCIVGCISIELGN